MNNAQPKPVGLEACKFAVDLRYVSTTKGFLKIYHLRMLKKDKFIWKLGGSLLGIVEFS